MIKDRQLGCLRRPGKDIEVRLSLQDVRNGIEGYRVGERRCLSNALVGAGLVLLSPGPQGTQVLLTRRQGQLRSHPGQIALPGGRVEPGEGHVDAALREAEEEVGLRPGSVEVVGSGPAVYIPPTRFWLVPVVAWWRQPHGLSIDPGEVATAYQVPLANLLSSDTWRCVPMPDRGPTWGWQLEGDLVWGATAVVIGHLLDTLIPDWSRGHRPDDLDGRRVIRPWESLPSTLRRVTLAGDIPVVDQGSLQHVTASQWTSLERQACEAGLSVAAQDQQLADALADGANRLVDMRQTGKALTVAAGPGRTGALGLRAALRLQRAGARVHALLARPSPALTSQLVRAGGRVTVVGQGDPVSVSDHLVIDAIVGTGMRASPTGSVRTLIEALQRCRAPILSVDLPSGLHPDTGYAGTAVTATTTVTIGAPKPAMLARTSQAFLGDLYLAQVALPDDVWIEAGLQPPARRCPSAPLVRLATPLPSDRAGALL